MGHSLFRVLVILAFLLVAAWIIGRFAPDPLLAKIGSVVLFLVALYVVFFQLLPLAGVHF